MKKYTVLALMAAICWTPAMAQDNTLPSRTLTIEGSYNPEATQAGKILPVPDKPQIKRQKTQVSYLNQPVIDFNLQRKPMAVFGLNSDGVVSSDLYGMVRLGYGLRNLHDGVLDFGWRITDKDILKINGLMDGWSSKPDGNWRSRMFNGGLNMGYVHQFKTIEVGVNGGFSHSHYNFRPGTAMDSAKLANSRLLQKVNRADLALTGKGQLGKASWNAKVAGLWLSHDNLILNSVIADKQVERQYRFDGGIGIPANGGVAGVDVSFRHMAYDWKIGNGQKYVDNSSFSLSPYWNGRLDNIDLYLGLNMNLHSKIGHKFLASPMLSMTFHLGEKFSLYAGVTGGLIENDIRNLESISPYFSTEEQITDGYNLLNVSTGAALETGTWVTLSGRVGYRRTIDEVFQVVQDEQNDMLVTSALKQQNSNVIYANLNADMQFTDRAQIKFDLTYNNYMGQYPGRKMELKPAFDASLYSRVNISGGLDAMLTYRLIVFHWISGVAMPSVNDLALTLDYDLMDNLSLYVTANKLAGGDFYYYAGYRALKPGLLLGATYRF